MRLATLAFAATVAFACDADRLIWIPRSQSADALYRFVKDGKAGYIDRNGRVVVPPKLRPWGNSGSEFHDGLLEIGVSNGIYVDRTGRVVIDKGLYRGWDFSEGLAVAMRKGERLWGFIDTSGEFAIQPQFASGPQDYVWPFRDGLARIEMNGKFGYIDHAGRFVIKPQFPDGMDFSNGMARVVTEGPCVYIPDGPCGAFNAHRVGGAEQTEQTPCKFTYIDKTGRVATEQRFEYARDFSEGLAPVRIGGLWGFIDKTGTVVVSPRFDDAEPFSSGLSRIRQRGPHSYADALYRYIDGLYGYADKSGAVKIRPQYRYAEDFSEGFAVVGDGNVYWYIDERGKRAFSGEFAAASPFFKGLAHIRLPGNDRVRFAYIDAKGHRVFEY